MCGIGALLDPAAIAGPSTAEAMVGALRHRGPDGDDWRRIGPALLVHTRLSIIDVEGGDQPLTSEDGTVTLVANGEIYNHKELRAGLEQRGHLFATHSDCEVILHLYEEVGPDCVHRLNGIFGFALWDARRKRLVAARDPFGVKPIYWAERGRRVAVGSEVGAVLAAGLGTTTIDPVALDHFLAWRFVPAPRTLFAGVQKLPAASYLVAEADRPVKVTSYREAPGAPSFDASPDRARRRAGRALQPGRRAPDDVRRAVRRVPQRRHRLGRDRGRDDPPRRQADQDLHDRLPRATTTRSTSARRPSLGEGDRHRAPQRRDDRDRLPRPDPRHDPAPRGAVRHPVRSGPAAAERVHDQVGQGGPLGPGRGRAAGRLLAPSGRRDAQVRRRAAGRRRGPRARLAGALPRNEKAKRAAGLLGSGDATGRLLGIFDIAPAELRAALTGTDGSEAAQERRALAEAVLADVGDRDPLEQTLYLDTHLFLPDGLLVYGDKMSMAHGLEQRVPFLDVELMRFVERVPAKVRVKGLKRKWLHKQAMAKLVPQEVIDRPKLGFSTPYDRWLREELGSEVGAALRPRRRAEPDDRSGDGRRARAGPPAGRADNKRLLYCLLELVGMAVAVLRRPAPALVAS